MAERILIVEDESALAEAVAYALEQEGFETETALDGHAALARFGQSVPDLVVLDLMLPGISGWDLFRAFRRQRPDLLIIMLTARADEPDRVAGLEMGADDYVTKPFSMRELVARVRVVLRRGSGAASTEPAVLTVAGVKLDRSRRRVEVDGREVALARREFDLLSYLMDNAGHVRTRDQILQAVWGQDEYLDERTVDVHVRWLRSKIESEPSRPWKLVTVRGVGYKFAEGS